MEERLHKIIASAGIASRRKAEELIKQGKVTVDGQVVTQMGLRLDPEQHEIAFEGKSISSHTQKIYLLLNKPKGYVTTLHDPQGRPEVTKLLKEIKTRVFPVGRLDIDTEGALMLTNDGDLAQRILHPSYEVNKTYIARVQGRPSKENLSRLEKGIELEGRKTWPARIRVVAGKPGSTSIEITIHEGKKRQVRKMFEAIGHPVQALKRTAYGNLKLANLPLGKYRFLTAKDLKLIFSGKNSLYNKKFT